MSNLNNMKMKKWIKKLSFPNLTFPMIFNYPVDPYIDKLLIECLDSGISGYEIIDSYDLVIRFKNGVSCNLWNANKYYAWLNKGVFTKDGKIFCKYSTARPSRSTIIRILNETSKFIGLTTIIK